MTKRAARLFFLAICCLAAFPIAAQSLAEAQRHFDAGRYEEARQICLARIGRAPADIEAYVLVSSSLLALERWADAENYALKGYELRRDPRFSELLGEAAFRLGRNEAALRNFQNYVASLPEGAKAGIVYYYMGEIYLRLARFNHADIAFTAALQYTPDNARWWARLAYTRERAKEPAHAIAAYEKALALDPRLDDARAGLARVKENLR